MAACALLQTQVAERGGLATHLEWSDLVETKGKLRVKIREVNGKTQMRTVPLNEAVAEWLRPFQAGEACLQVPARVKHNSAKGYLEVTRSWPRTSSVGSAASVEPRTSSVGSAASVEPAERDASHRLFPGLTVNYFERILREKVRPWLTKECAKNPRARSDMGIVDIARIRTHSFRRGPVTWLKEFVKSDVVVGGVAGMCARRVRSCYDELSERRVMTAQAHLSAYVTYTADLRQMSDMSDAIYMVESDSEGEVIVLNADVASAEFDESADESIEEISDVTDTSEDDAEKTVMVRLCPVLSEGERQKRKARRAVRRIVHDEVREAIAGLLSNIPAEFSRAPKTCRVR